MDHFDSLVSEQLKTMEKLLFIQSEIERCQEIEAQLLSLQNETELQTVQDEIKIMKQELSDIHALFHKQTEEVIQSYQEKLQQIV